MMRLALRPQHFTEDIQVVPFVEWSEKIWKWKPVKSLTASHSELKNKICTASLRANANFEGWKKNLVKKKRINKI